MIESSRGGYGFTARRHDNYLKPGMSLELEKEIFMMFDSNVLGALESGIANAEAQKCAAKYIRRLTNQSAHQNGQQMGFDEWWNIHGSNIVPAEGDDHEEHARKVAAQAWADQSSANDA